MSALERLHSAVRRWLARYDSTTPSMSQQPTIDVSSSSPAVEGKSDEMWEVTVSSVPAAAGYRRGPVGWAGTDQQVRWMLVRASLKIVVAARTPQQAASDALDALADMDSDVVLTAVQDVATSHGVTPPFKQLSSLRLMDLDRIDLEDVRPVSGASDEN